MVWGDRILWGETVAPRGRFTHKSNYPYNMTTKTGQGDSTTNPEKNPLTYADAGVNINAGDRMVGMIQHAMRKTHGPRVIDQPGGFANLFRLDYNEKLFRRNFRDPVLVACTDGVGTKVKLAIELKQYDTIGIDCVAMNVNDLIVQGAEPLFFLDYLAVNTLEPEVATAIVKGVSTGCVESGCALIGGETAEMSDLYQSGDFDLAGFAVGVVELEKAIDPSRVETGDIVIGLESSGLHSNGYTLVRAIIKKANLNLDQIYPELDEQKTLGQILLTPTRLYAKSIVQLLRKYTVKKVVSGMAHITGGGLEGNVNRALSDDVSASIQTNTWEIPKIFQFLAEKGNVAQDEMFRVFNMGIGFVLIVRPSFANSIMRHLEKSGEKPKELGRIIKGNGQVLLQK